MNLNSKRATRAEAFRLYAVGMPQKEIAQSLRVSENTVCKWKKDGEWEARLRLQDATKVGDAYLLVSENLRQLIHEKTKDGRHTPEGADSLNTALTTVYQALAENRLL